MKSCTLHFVCSCLCCGSSCCWEQGHQSSQASHSPSLVYKICPYKIKGLLTSIVACATGGETLQRSICREPVVYYFSYSALQCCMCCCMTTEAADVLCYPGTAHQTSICICFTLAAASSPMLPPILAYVIVALFAASSYTTLRTVRI